MHNIAGKEADFAAWSTRFWARVLEGKRPPCDEEEEEGEGVLGKKKKKRKKSHDCSGGCGDGGSCSTKNKQHTEENGEVLLFFYSLFWIARKYNGHNLSFPLKKMPKCWKNSKTQVAPLLVFFDFGCQLKMLLEESL